MEKDMSGLVRVRYCKAPMMLRYWVTSAVGVPSFNMRVVVGDRGVSDGLGLAISNLWIISQMNLCWERNRHEVLGMSSIPKK